jgi:LmbE family N-acetylglucosaminyl deacetylase
MITGTATLAITSTGLAAPRPLEPPAAGDLQQALEKLGTVGSVLYVAAHPDDENTRLMAWLAGEKKVRVAYASMTRGDGGQNLVGPELGPLLGVVRTQELLAARRIDGAEQFFTRAIDFGYSKNPEETLRIWGRDAVLADLVRIIRTFRPDVVVARFDLQQPNHGHHTASAILAREAFAAAADPARFPDSLPPHQARVLLENKSSWRFKPGQDLSGYLSVDVGTYNPLLGRSTSEIAAAGRTMHKSQGFGVAPELGPVPEYFEVTATAPDVAAPTGDPFANVETGWKRYPGTERLRERLDAARKAFDGAHPARMLPALADVHTELRKLPDDNPARAPKLAEVQALMVAAAGVVLDPRATTAAVIPGLPADIKAALLARVADGVVVNGVTWPDGERSDPPGALARGALTSVTRTMTMPTTTPFSTPFWLAEPPAPPATGSPAGLYSVPNPDLGILPEAPPDLPVVFDVTIAGTRFDVVRPLRYAEVDRVQGERIRSVEVLPPVTVTPAASTLMLANGDRGTLRVRVTAHADGQSGKAFLQVAAGYRVAPESIDFNLAKTGDTVDLAFTVTPPKGASQASELTAVAQVGDRTVTLRSDPINHAHIPALTVLAPARVKVVPIAIRKGGTRIGYIPGAGDEVAESLRQVGYDVTVLDDAALATGDLDGYAAIVGGIRAYNVNPRLGTVHDHLMRYVERGGTYLVQYVTSTSRMPYLGAAIGPFPFAIDADRVTDETAEMTPVDPKSRTLTAPNVLTAADQANWVQERGLYFAKTWDARYQALFTAHDPGEAPLQGGTLIARHGKGAFLYTGLAFFRQLPAGVPGAYRLLANLLATKGAR